MVMASKKLFLSLAVFLLLVAATAPAAGAEWVITWEPVKQVFSGPIKIRLKEFPEAMAKNASWTDTVFFYGTANWQLSIYRYSATSISIDFSKINAQSVTGYDLTYSYNPFTATWSRRNGAFGGLVPCLWDDVNQEIEIASISYIQGTYLTDVNAVIEVKKEVWVEPPTVPPTTQSPEEIEAQDNLNNWAWLFGIMDKLWQFMWQFRIWGIPFIPLLVSLTVAAFVIRVFWLGARGDSTVNG